MYTLIKMCIGCCLRVLTCTGCIFIGYLLFLGTQAYGAFDFLKDNQAVTSDTKNVSSIESFDSKASVVTITPQDIQKALQKALQDRYTIDGDLKIFLVSSIRDIQVLSDDWQLELIQSPPDTISQNCSATFAIMDGNKNRGQWTVSLRAELWQKAYVSKKNIEKGTLLSSEDFDIGAADVLRMGGKNVPVGVTLGQCIADQTIQAGHILVYNAIRQRPMVQKGHIVEAIASDNGLKISMKAKALEDGVKDAVITVMNLQSKKIIQGQVVDENKIKVYF